jgi:hypothetical protein
MSHRLFLEESMTPLRTLEQFLHTNTNPYVYLFTIAD